MSICWKSVQGRIDRVHENETLSIKINFDDVTKGNRKKCYPHWPQIPTIHI